MAKCNFKGCNRDVHDARGKCSLHLEKKKNSCDEDFNSKFRIELSDYLAKLAIKELDNKGIDKAINLEVIRQVLNLTSINQENDARIIKLLTDISIIVEDIDFMILGESAPDYIKILEKIGSIHFKKCKFRLWNAYFTKSAKLSYENCQFYQS